MEYYRIRVGGHLEQRWSEALGGLALTCKEDGTTILEGPLPDQSALFGILLHMRDLNLRLLSVQLGTTDESSAAQVRYHDVGWIEEVSEFSDTSIPPEL